MYCAVFRYSFQRRLPSVRHTVFSQPEFFAVIEVVAVDGQRFRTHDRPAHFNACVDQNKSIVFCPHSDRDIAIILINQGFTLRLQAETETNYRQEQCPDLY